MTTDEKVHRWVDLMRSCLFAFFTLFFTASAFANPPVASYIFPPGGQRGKTVPIKVGGLFLHEQCPFALIGPGVKASPILKRTDTLWFEGPLLPIPESQQAEDYPQDMAGEITIAPDAPLGFRYGRVWTSQGAAPHLKFVVGDLPEIVENEIDGDPVPVLVNPPITINGRIFPREDVDVWTIKAKKGETYSCIVNAARLGSPLDARLEVLDVKGRVLFENEDAYGADPAIHFTAPADGLYQIRIRDSLMQGGQAYVYRLTIGAGPFVDRVFPLGGRQGTTLKLDLSGHGLTAPSLDVLLPAESVKSVRWQPHVPGQHLQPVWLDVDDLPEAVEGRDDPAMPLQCPIIVNGRITKAGEVDEWMIDGKKGELLTIEMRASQLGSPLDAVVVILDKGGKELFRLEGDKAAEFVPSENGTYGVKVSERIRSRGGPAFAYRLKIAPAKPDFQVLLAADAITAPRKGQVKIKLTVARQGGFKDPIAITAENLPAGVAATPLTIAANQNTGDLTLKIDAVAPIAAQEIRILGTPAPKSDKDTKKRVDAKDPVESSPTLPPRQATLALGRSEATLDTVLLAVALPTPFVIKGEYDMGFAARGGLHRRSYKIERNGFDGPIEVRLADRQARHLQGVIGPTIVVPADKSEFIYEAFLPPGMELGRTCRVCVMGTGVIRDGEREHKVSFSSVNPNEQLVCVIGPGHLAMDLGRVSIPLRHGQTVDVPIRIKRGINWQGPIQVAILGPRHMQGIEAEPAIIPANEERGVLRIRIASGPVGPNTMPLTIRATLVQGTQRIVADSPLELTDE